MFKAVRLFIARLFVPSELMALARYRKAIYEAVDREPWNAGLRWVRNVGEGHTDHPTPASTVYPTNLIPKDGSVFLLVLKSGVGGVVQAQWTDEDPLYPIRFIDTHNGQWIVNRIRVDACSAWLPMPQAGVSRP